MLQLTFDSGTLLLRNLAPASPLHALPFVLWDPRIRTHRAPAFHYRAIITVLRQHQLPYVDEVFARRAMVKGWTMPELRPYQHAALLAWDAAHRAGLVVLPTGSGKTRLACAAMAAGHVPSLCLVPTRALLHQWREEIARHYAGPIGCIGDGERSIEDVTVATFESAYRNMVRLGHRFGLIVVDEVHHFGCGMRDEALEMSAAPRRLGLTATAPEGDALARVMTLTGPVVCELAIGDLAGEWLADFEIIVLTLRLTVSEQHQYDGAVAAFRAVFDSFRAFSRTAQWSDFVAMASRSQQGRAALASFRYSRRLTSYPEAKRSAVAEVLARHRDSRILVFTSDNDTAYAIAREHLVMPITCDITRAERDLALAAFRAGQLRVLVSARVLNEGLDVPDAEVAIIVGGMSGEREHVQRVGRLLRPSPGKHALVYELVAGGTHEVKKANERRRSLASTNHSTR